MHRVFLDLRYADERRSSRNVDNDLAGTARIRTRTGQIYEYEILDGVGWSSREVKIGLTYGDPKLIGPEFTLSGSWNGASLRLAASDNPSGPDGAYRRETPSSTDDPDDSFPPVHLKPRSLADLESDCRGSMSAA